MSRHRVRAAGATLWALVRDAQHDYVFVES